METEYSDPVKIRRSKIRAITTDQPKEVHLSGGEVIRGKLGAAGEGRVLVEATEERGEITVDSASIAAINPPPLPLRDGKGM